MEKNKFKQNQFSPYLLSFVLILITTLLGELAKKHLEPTNIVMFYLLIVVFVAMKWGRGPAIATSIISVSMFDFFLIPPYLTFSVADIQYLFTFIAFLVVAIAMSSFASKMRENIIQKQTEKLYSALLSSISHDLKTPLVSITGVLSTLLDNKNLAGQQKNQLLETAYKESDRLNQIVNNLLDMTRVEAEVLRIRKKPCDLRDLVGACLEQCKDKIGNRDIKIDIPKDSPEICVDFPFMLKALYNIIDNALKYSSPDKPVEIRALFDRQNVKIFIKDSGLGIAKDDLRKIFDKFYRVERAENVPGTGLGLCISKGIVEAHHGKISAESTLGQGSAFTVEIPIT